MSSFLDPAILFFAFGVLAGTLRFNLEIPQPISRFLSLYLLMALGLKGGFALAKSGLTAEVASSLVCAVVLAVVIPALSYFLLKRIVSAFDAAAIAATCGSVSAVTFITAVQYLENNGIGYGGHMAAAMALMESPAIVLAVLAASASCIAVPGVLRHALPEAKPSLYFGMSLGLTFPFNILLGIPLYVGAAGYFLG